MNEKTIELIESTETNWKVEKRPLFDANGTETNSFGIFRADTNLWLGTVGNKYEPMQNEELASVLISAADQLGIKMTRGGEQDGGKRIFYQAELPDAHVGRSDIQRWITSLNFHDGSGAIAFGSTNTVVVCRNTFYMAYGELQKFRHIPSVIKQIEVAKDDLVMALDWDNELIKAYQLMDTMPIEDELTDRVVASMFDVDIKKPIDEFSTRMFNHVDDFTSSVEKSVAEQGGKTVWALFNGITRFTNHVLVPENEDTLDYVMGKSGQKIAKAGFREIMGWVKKYSKEEVRVPIV